MAFLVGAGTAFMPSVVLKERMLDYQCPVAPVTLEEPLRVVGLELLRFDRVYFEDLVGGIAEVLNLRLQPLDPSGTCVHTVANMNFRFDQKICPSKGRRIDLAVETSYPMRKATEVTHQHHQILRLPMEHDIGYCYHYSSTANIGHC